MKRALVVTDIHEFESHVDELIEIYEPDLVLDCGDHEETFFTDKTVPWYFIPGNHENNQIIERMRQGERPYKNLHIINPGDIITIEDVTIGGFGGNYSHKTFIGEKKKPKPYHIIPSDVKAMKEIAKRKKNLDILLMHESTKELWEPLKDKYPFGQEVHSEIVSQFPQLSLVVSGHYHVPQERTINSTKQVSLNTPENYAHLILSLDKGKVSIDEYQNPFSTNYYKPTFDE